MTYPAQSYSIIFSAFLSLTGSGALQGYAATKNANGTGYVIATTAALAASHSGTIDGIFLSNGDPNTSVQIQRDAKVDGSVMPWLGAGAIENAVVDANGKVQRASVASGVVIGTVDKEGGVSINLAGSGAVAALNLVGDVNGPTSNNKVWSISGNAGAVSILGGAWSIAAAVALAITQVSAPANGAVNDIAFETQSANAAPTTGGTIGGNYQVTLGSNTAALSTPWLNPDVPALNVNYRDRSAGVVNIASISPTRFFNAAGIGAGMYLNGANSWLDIGATPPLSLGVIGVDNGTDAIATRNHANLADMVVIGTDTSDYVVLARTGAAGVKVAPLAGSGTRMVTADAAGVLSTQAIPSGTTYGNDLDAASVAGNQIVDSLTGAAGIVLVRGTAALQFGSTNPAASGLVRMANATSMVVMRNAANTADIVALQGDASDQVYLGTLNGGVVAAPVAGNLYLFATSVARLAINGGTGMVTLSNGLTVSGLAGGGSRAVICDNAGVVSAVAGGSTGNVLTYNGTTWVSSPPSGSGVTWATDLAGSTNTSQIVIALTGTTGVTTVRSNGATNAIAFGSSGAAASGEARFKNDGSLKWRNAAGTADVAGLTVDASNQVILGATLPSGIVCRTATNAIDLYTGGVARLSLTDTLATFATNLAMGTNTITFGASPASAGPVRFSNAQQINFRNAANTADVNALTVDSSDQPILGNTNGGVVAAPGSFQCTIWAGGGGRFIADGSTGFCAVIDNLYVGASSATMNSATHTIYVKDGTQPSAAPATGVYLGSDSGSLHFRSSFFSGGVPCNIKFVEVTGGMTSTIDPDHAIKIIIDKPGSATQTRYLRPYL